ncbi:MAG: RES domain-containing protein [Gammaproteobacteria bacterium]|nr:RES domain-containing protein [Gammaproteobacteria bacterium]
MIRAYRLVKRRQSASAFDGEGARRFGGRWNSKGQACIYLTSSISLGHLEIMVHISDYHLLRQYVVLSLDLEARDMMVLPDDALPNDWREYPAPLSTAVIGNEWLASRESAVLSVPSVIVPSERNYLLNPRHPRFTAIIKTVREEVFSFDPRLALTGGK